LINGKSVWGTDGWVSGMGISAGGDQIFIDSHSFNNIIFS